MKHANPQAFPPFTNYFYAIDGQVVLINKGHYNEARLAVFRHQLYAKLNRSWVRLMDGNITSVSGITWTEIDTEGLPITTVTGTLCLKPEEEQPKPISRKKG